MNGIWVGLSWRVSEAAVRDLLLGWFPSLEVTTQAEAINADRSPWPPIVFSVEERPGVEDFPTYIGFDCFPGPSEHAVKVGAVLARRLASAFACRSVCDGSGCGDDESPYWSIVWTQGQSYLADDCGSAFADGSGGPIKIVRELHLEQMELDQNGCLTDAQAPS